MGSFIVYTNLPIWQILNKLDLEVRPLLQALCPIKSQVLVDFIVELTTPIGEIPWILFIVKAFKQQGSKVGIILEGLDRVLLEQSLHFNFKANNNQAKYETLLARMYLAWEIGASRTYSRGGSLKLFKLKIPNLGNTLINLVQYLLFHTCPSRRKHTSRPPFQARYLPQYLPTERVVDCLHPQKKQRRWLRMLPIT
ncbi:hypothetical protein CR513_16444, partial [Mucuna pruriens]